MAILTAEQKRVIAQQFVRKAYRDAAKPADQDADQITASIQAVEDWINDNTASYNAALPDPFKSTATAAEKTLLLLYVISRQAGII